MSIPAPTSSVPTACRTTNGDPVRFALVLIVALLLLGGCTWFRSSARDLRVMETALKAESAQAQRTMMELRAEIQRLQQELGAARTAQARLEGDLREAQRRLTETQRTVEAQREDLARAREERDRLAQSGREFQGQMAELGRLRQQVAEAVRDQTRDQSRDQARIQSLEAAIEKQSQEMAELRASVPRSSAKSKSKSANAGAPPVSVSKGAPKGGASVGGSSGPTPRTVTVERGDTLWNLARKYRVDLAELKALNHIVSDLIVPGQELLLPDSPRG